jgi:molybdopterin-containing oxidoreductase family membrane subunit
MFPGWEVTSGFHDGAVASYTPSLPEFGLGLGGLALAGAIVLIGLKVLRFLPATLADNTPED